MEDITVTIEDVYVPVRRRHSRDESYIDDLAESILAEGLRQPILVRRDDKRKFVLVDGLHRLEACRALGEATIAATVVRARMR